MYAWLARVLYIHTPKTYLVRNKVPKIISGRAQAVYVCTKIVVQKRFYCWQLSLNQFQGECYNSVMSIKSAYMAEVRGVWCHGM